MGLDISVCSLLLVNAINFKLQVLGLVVTPSQRSCAAFFRPQQYLLFINSHGDCSPQLCCY